MCEWHRVKNGPPFLFRCKVCYMLKRRDNSGKWRYFADAVTRKRWSERPYRRNHAQHINILAMTPYGWSYEACYRSKGLLMRETDGYVVNHAGTATHVALKTVSKKEVEEGLALKVPKMWGRRSSGCRRHKDRSRQPKSVAKSSH